MHRLVTTIGTLGVCALTSCASQPPPPPVTASPGGTEGSVTFTGGAVAIGIGFQWGSGTLTYQGRQYPFSLNGLSVVDVGVTRVTGSGSVHNLRNVADFSGNYVSIAAGATVAGGGSVTSLRNQNGVVIDGVTTAQGVRLTLAPGGANITRKRSGRRQGLEARTAPPPLPWLDLRARLTRKYQRRRAAPRRRRCGGHASGKPGRTGSRKVQRSVRRLLGRRGGIGTTASAC